MHCLQVINARNQYKYERVIDRPRKPHEQGNRFWRCDCPGVQGIRHYTCKSCDKCNTTRATAGGPFAPGHGPLKG